MMRCNIAREQLQRLIVGDRSRRATLAALAHLARCPQCRREWRQVRQVRSTARRLPDPSLPADIRTRMLAQIADMPVPASGDPAPPNATQRRTNPMLQRTLIAGVCLTAAVAGFLLLTSHSRHHALLAMGNVKQALEHVNTWHLKGWKLDGNKEIPWEVWGRKTPFFYHERIGDRETLDDGHDRIIVFPAHTAYRNEHAVALKIPSRPNTQSSMGLSFALGLERQATNGFDKWSQDGDKEMLTREEMTIGSQKPIRVNGLFTFAQGSPLPIRYERQMVEYRAPNPHEVPDLSTLPASAKINEWTGAVLEAQYDIDLGNDALQVAPPVDTQWVDAVRDSAAPGMPTQNAATQNGLTLHVDEARVDPEGDVLLRFAGYVGSAKFIAARAKGDHLPFSFDTAARAGAMRDQMGNLVYSGLPNSVIAHDDRGRDYIAVSLEFQRYLDGRAWLPLAPLEPLRPGDPLPRRMAFDMEMTLNTYQMLPDQQQGATSVELDKELLHCDVELPATAAEMDLQALSNQYGDPDKIEERGFFLHFAQAAVQARAYSWRDVAEETLNKYLAGQFVARQQDPNAPPDVAGKRRAEQALQSAIHYIRLAQQQLPPHTTQGMQSNLEGLKKEFAERLK